MLYDLVKDKKKTPTSTPPYTTKLNTLDEPITKAWRFETQI